ncbi:adipocyte plasma membrane-associated protein-like isoform X2 [Mercenaria mercenaria]|uniref:adipocyte plasma membrane-associated protein-like isoform X2 n=1 Tax=Mercenaria mercenaria TaxID=6596 RepID=UPI00234F19B1|nr:adipocyte plasma membrane-associated protein-like isoform X2 [Mercenaria mercenaria]
MHIAKIYHFRWLKAALTSTFLTFCAIPLILMLIPTPIKPEYIRLPQRPEWTDTLRPNKHLQKAKKLFYDKIQGPESLVVDGDYLYTGTADGKIMEIYKGELRVLTRLGQEPCGRFEDEPTCGRPLGMRMDKDGYLIVADAYLGLFKVNVATGDKTVLWPSSEPINGRRPNFMNDLDIGPDGTIYVSDSSTKWDRRHNRYCFFEGESSGRLFSYNPTTNTTKELVTGIPFANGVTLTRDKSAILLTSTTKAAVYRYNLDGPNKGKLEDFNNNLPGIPDNIRRSAKGGYWVGLAGVRKPEFSLIDLSAANPWIRGIVTKIFSQEMIMKMVPSYGLVVELNEYGHIVRTLHDPSGKVIPSVSEVEDTGTVLYLGSYNLPFLSKLYAVDILDVA